jgi:hypothetical protein
MVAGATVSPRGGRDGLLALIGIDDLPADPELQPIGRALLR